MTALAPVASPASAATVLGPSPRMVAVCLATLYVVWSSTYLALRYVVVEMAPLGSAGARFLLAGLVLLAIVLGRGIPLPTARQRRAAALTGVLVFAMGNGFVAVAEQTSSSGLAAVVCASMPCFACIFDALGGRKLSAREVLGIGLGFAGVVVLSVGAVAARPSWTTGLLFLAPVAWALGSVLGRRFFVGAHVLATASFQMLGGGTAALLLSVVTRERAFAHGPPSLKAIVAFLYLVVVGSLIAFSAYAWLLANTSVAVATSYAFVNPVIALLLGVVVGGEAVGKSVPFAVVLVLGGLFLVLRRPASRVPTEPQPVSTVPSGSAATAMRRDETEAERR